MVRFRKATQDDKEAIVALNEEFVAVTSPMNTDKFLELLALSAHCVVAEQDNIVIGFVLAMHADADYQNGNYQWFDERLKNFVYIDRIIIPKSGQRLGLGKKLYDHITTAARDAGCLTMTAEVDCKPANTQSLNFHQKTGFVQIGTRALENGKTVAMLIKNLA